MTRARWLPLTMAMTIVAASAATASADAVDQTYSNWRYGYEIAYPAVLAPQGEADAGDGQVFRSKNGDAELRVSGSSCIDETDYPKRFLNEYAQDEQQHKLRVTYRHRTKKTASVSGLRGARIFYARALFDDGQCARFTLEYDPAQRDRYDRIAAAIAASFKPFNEMPVPAGK